MWEIVRASETINTIRRFPAMLSATEESRVRGKENMPVFFSLSMLNLDELGWKMTYHEPLWSMLFLSCKHGVCWKISRRAAFSRTQLCWSEAVTGLWRRQRQRKQSTSLTSRDKRELGWMSRKMSSEKFGRTTLRVPKSSLTSVLTKPVAA